MDSCVSPAGTGSACTMPECQCRLDLFQASCSRGASQAPSRVHIVAGWTLAGGSGLAVAECAHSSVCVPGVASGLYVVSLYASESAMRAAPACEHSLPFCRPPSYECVTDRWPVVAGLGLVYVVIIAVSLPGSIDQAQPDIRFAFCLSGLSAASNLAPRVICHWRRCLILTSYTRMTRSLFWMTVHLLTLNCSKTGFLLIGLKQQLAVIRDSSLSIMLNVLHSQMTT